MLSDEDRVSKTDRQDERRHHASGVQAGTRRRCPARLQVAAANLAIVILFLAEAGPDMTLLAGSGPAGKVPTDLEGCDDEAEEEAVFAGV